MCIVRERRPAGFLDMKCQTSIIGSALAEAQDNYIILFSIALLQLQLWYFELQFPLNSSCTITAVIGGVVLPVAKLLQQFDGS